MFFLSPKLALFSTSAITEATLISTTRSSSAPSAAGRSGQVRSGQVRGETGRVGDTGRGREGRDTYEDPAAHGDGLRQRHVRAGQVGGRAQLGVVRAHLNQLPLHQLQLASEGGVHCARADLRTLRVCHAGDKKGRNEGRNVLRKQEKYSPTFNKFHIFGWKFVCMHAQSYTEHDSNMYSWSRGDSSSQSLQGGVVRSVISVGKVESRDVHARVDQAAQTFHRPAGWSKGTDDLRLPARDIIRASNMLQSVF